MDGKKIDEEAKILQ